MATLTKHKKLKPEKYLTEGKFGIFEKNFEKQMTTIAKSFHSIDERFKSVDERFDIVITEIRNLHEDNKHMQSTLNSFVREISSHDRQIDNILVRVEKLEEKIK